VGITQIVQAEQRRQPGLGQVMQWVSAPGFAPWSWVIPIGTAGLLRWFGYRLEAGFMLSTGLANAIVALIKIALARPRPADPSIVVTAHLPDYSFPSGHTIQYVAQFGYIAYLAFALLRPTRWRQAVIGLCAALIGLVGPSRVGLGQHWASDVAASYCLGTAFMIGHIGLYRRLKSGQRPVTAHTSQTLPADAASVSVRAGTDAAVPSGGGG
jgi:membrane-associated phospholipid phosphatase